MDDYDSQVTLEKILKIAPNVKVFDANSGLYLNIKC